MLSETKGRLIDYLWNSSNKIPLDIIGKMKDSISEIGKFINNVNNISTDMLNKLPISGMACSDIDGLTKFYNTEVEAGNMFNSIKDDSNKHLKIGSILLLEEIENSMVKVKFYRTGMP